jgi:hypothetical protein
MNTRAQIATILSALAIAAHPAHAQERAILPRTDADALIEAGKWPEAEEMLYATVAADPRDPLARAALGRYLAMKGALTPGLVLIDEAREFGLPATTARELTAPIRVLLDWRQREAAGARDTVLSVRAPSSPGAVLRFPVARDDGRDTIWADVVPRMIGLDSAFGSRPRVGIEVLEGLVPEYELSTRTLRLHADPASAVSAKGRRYPVLRTSDGVRVLIAPGRVRPLADALRVLDARWWQLDLLHGVLIVR